MLITPTHSIVLLSLTEDSRSLFVLHTATTNGDAVCGPIVNTLFTLCTATKRHGGMHYLLLAAAKASRLPVERAKLPSVL